MPIDAPSEIVLINQDEFQEMAHRLLGIVFEVHNDLGRFLCEELYKREFVARWSELGCGAVEREVRILVSHESFNKEYRLDLLFDHRLMLEAKTREAIVPADRTQGLNYLFLTGMKHGLLVNLRPQRIEHEYLSTRITAHKRREIHVVENEWAVPNSESEWFKKKLLELLMDWGAFLDANLYRDAIAHFLGSPEGVTTKVPVYSGSRCLGEQAVHLLNETTAFAITATTANQRAMRHHLSRFLHHTPLRYVQWVNLNHHDIEFRTLAK